MRLLTLFFVLICTPVFAQESVLPGSVPEAMMPEMAAPPADGAEIPGPPMAPPVDPAEVIMIEPVGNAMAPEIPVMEDGAGPPMAPEVDPAMVVEVPVDMRPPALPPEVIPVDEGAGPPMPPAPDPSQVIIPDPPPVATEPVRVLSSPPAEPLDLVPFDPGSPGEPGKGDLISVGDELHIEISHPEQMLVVTTVSQDGMVSVPEFGSVLAQGKSAEEVQQAILKLFPETEHPGAQVTVMIKEKGEESASP